MDIVINQIQAGDAKSLASFYNGLSAPSKRTFHPLGDVTTTQRCDEIVADNKPGGVKYDLVAWDGGCIVGWSFLWNWNVEAPTFGLGVADTHHGQGLGGRLMDAVLAHGLERGATKIALTVVQDNDKARGMYERRGFTIQSAFIGDDGLPYYGMAAQFRKDVSS